jgi:pimeloyl-ACP methyl ester carboxylesterase/DNA-binding CsgD family transcriptional regulator
MVRPSVGFMIRPKVQYARADDGVTIAYSTFGEGPVTLVLISPLISQVEVAWEEPAFEHFMSCLAACTRVVMFDRRGTGLSDHTTASGDRLALPQLASDILAVLDSCEAPRAVIFGASLGAMTGVQFAATFAERTEALILVGGSPQVTMSAGVEPVFERAALDEQVDAIARAWGTGAMAGAYAPSMRDNERFRDWLARLERHTCSPGMAAASMRWAAKYDVRPLLGTLVAPTLVVHRAGDTGIPVGHGRYLGAHIPDATYVELPGEDHMFFLGDQETMVDTIITFLDEQVAGGALGAALRRAERKNAYGYGWESLTPSEREVALLVAQGMTNSEVADRLRMSRYTVDGRLRRVFVKLDVATRVELAAEYSRVAR